MLLLWQHDPNKVSITAVLTDWYTSTNRHQKGVATHYLRNMKPAADFKPKVPGVN